MSDAVRDLRSSGMQKKLFGGKSPLSFGALKSIPLLHSSPVLKLTSSLQTPLQLFRLQSSSSSTAAAASRTTTCCTMRHHNVLLYLLLGLLTTTGVVGVSVNEVRVPQPGVVGDPAKLECLWEASGRFYSVRWYKNGDQFYSYIRGNDPEKVDHGLFGVNVDLDFSNENQVVLRELTPASEGTYRCEVMSEAPFFKTSFSSANLTVVSMPTNPEINGFRPRYQVSEILNVSCTARNTRPRARLTFHVNEEKMHHDSVRVRELGVVEDPRRGSYTTTSQLVLPLSTRYGSTLTVTCRARILTITKDTTLKARVTPARTIKLSFFNGGTGGQVPTSAALLVASVTSSVVMLGTFVEW